jgi:D-arabinose 1-dehydrogenase-like Zn-dependent alcohol dehydrogenase
MKAQAMTAFGAPLTPMDLDAQKPGPGEALVRVTRAGLCHSDLHIHDGYFDFGDVASLSPSNMPAVLGHEIEGEVAELGEGAAGPAPGTRVAVYPWLGCNACDTCRAGDQQLCIALPRRALGVAKWGGMAEYVHVPFADALIPIGDLTPGLGALAMCSGLTAYSALKKIGAPPPINLFYCSAWAASVSWPWRLPRACCPIRSSPPTSTPQSAKRRLKYGAVDAIEPNADAWKDVLARHGAAAAAIDFVGAPATFGFGTSAPCGAAANTSSSDCSAAKRPAARLVAAEDQSRSSARMSAAWTKRANSSHCLRNGAAPAPPMHERPLDRSQQRHRRSARAGKVLGRVLLKP